MGKPSRIFFRGQPQLKLILVTGIASIGMNTQAVTLNDAIESAMRVDPSLRASKLNHQAMEEQIAIARSRLLPQISLQGSSSQLTQTTTQDLNAGGSVERSFTGPSINHQFVIRQALLRPKEMSALRFAELQTQFTSLKSKADTIELKTKVFYAWIDLISAQQITQAYQRPLQFVEIFAKQEQARYDQGETTKDAAIEAEALYESSKSAHLQSIEILKAKQRAFENLTKIPSNALLGKSLNFESELTLTEFQRTSIRESFLESSVELQMAKLQEQMQLERLIMAEADHKPTVDVLASINLAQNDATSTQGYQYRNKQIGVQYTIPLFAGGGISAAVRQAKYAYQASNLDLEATETRIVNEFDSAWAVVVGNHLRYKSLLITVLASQEMVSANKRAYELGIKNISDLSSAEVSLSKKTIDLISTIQEYLKSKYKIKKIETKSFN